MWSYRIIVIDGNGRFVEVIELDASPNVGDVLDLDHIRVTTRDVVSDDQFAGTIFAAPLA